LWTGLLAFVERLASLGDEKGHSVPFTLAVVVLSSEQQPMLWTGFLAFVERLASLGDEKGHSVPFSLAVVVLFGSLLFGGFTVFTYPNFSPHGVWVCEGLVYKFVQPMIIICFDRSSLYLLS
jgi:hypothetical protein